MAHPDRNMRRGSGRRGPRTRSLCVSELEKLAIKNEQEENNNETNATTAVPSTQVPAEAPQEILTVLPSVPLAALVDRPEYQLSFEDVSRFDHFYILEFFLFFF